MRACNAFGVSGIHVMTADVTSDERADRWLRWAATFFVLAVLFHNSDHLRRGSDTLSTDVFVAGSLAMIVEIGVVVLVFMRHRWAAIAAVAAGFPLAAGYVFVHFTPGRGWLSDSFVSESVSVVSRLAASTEVVAALAIGLAGLLAVRRRGLDAAASGPTSDVRLGAVVRQPLVAAMVVGNVLIFALTLVSR